MKTTRIPLLLFFAALCSYTFSYAQLINRCSTTELMAMYEQQAPGTLLKIQQADEMAQQWLKDHPENVREVVTIPVVVHVVYKTASQNISDDQVRSQIDVLNEDYRKINVDTNNTPEIYKPLAGDAMIEFCLAAVDPNGDTTSGITRTATTKVNFSLGDSIKSAALGGADPWPADQYLNIWVCNLSDNVLGYATLPTNDPVPPANDGVVVFYKAFGREGILSSTYNLGRTCTHEVGHWLGLTHIWGDDGGSCSGSDNIADTPNQADANFGCPAFPHITCSNQGDMSMNYMDYTDDACMNLFTLDQCTKMNAVLNSSRESLKSSPAGCQGVKFSLDASISKIIYPLDTVNALSFQPQVQVTNRGLINLDNVQIYYQVDGQDPAIFEFQGSLVTNASQVITLPFYFTGEGGHVFTAWSGSPNFGTDQYPFNDTATSEFTVVSLIPKNSVDFQDPFEPGVYFSFQIQNPSAGDLDLWVVNTIGQVMKHHSVSIISQPTIELNLSDLADGIYFLYGKIGFDYITKKVLVWH
jgi:hypothetical protein